MGEILRLVAGGLIALVCAYVGVIIKKRFKSRQKFFEDARDYFAFFEREITSFKTPMPIVNEKFATSKRGEFANFLKEYFDKTSQKKNNSPLKTDEKTMLEEALGGLGKSAYGEQLQYLKRWQGEYSKVAEKAAADNKKYGGMYFKLCVLLGIAVIILLV